MPGDSKTFRKPSKARKQRKAKTKNARQDQRIKHLEKMLLPAVEIKTNDVYAQNAPVSDSGYVNQPMMQIGQGTDGGATGQRVGDKVTLLSHNITMKLNSSDDTNVMRILWVYTESTDTLALSDVLQYSSTGEYALVSPYKLRSTNNNIKYKVMFDKVYKFDASTAVIVDKYKLLPGGKYGKQVEFNATGRIQPEQYKLHIIAVSDSGAISHPSISYVCRTKYYDL